MRKETTTAHLPPCGAATHIEQLVVLLCGDLRRRLSCRLAIPVCSRHAMFGCENSRHPELDYTWSAALEQLQVQTRMLTEPRHIVCRWLCGGAHESNRMTMLSGLMADSLASFAPKPCTGASGSPRFVTCGNQKP